MSDSAGIFGEQNLQTATLDELTSAVNYRESLVRLSLPWLGEHAIEVGSGNGDYAQSWAQHGKRLTATEILPSRLEALKARFHGEALVDVEELRIPSDHQRGFSSAIAYNVLEHIEDDIEAIASMRRLVRTGGHVVILVPAFQIAMSRFDREIGHFRRYRRGDLAQTLRTAGLEPVVVRYVNSVGLLLWIATVRGHRRAPRNSATLRYYDRFVVPLVSWLEDRVEFPFGQSVFAVGQKTTP